MVERTLLGSLAEGRQKRIIEKTLAESLTEGRQRRMVDRPEGITTTDYLKEKVSSVIIIIKT
jgi:hypothetical protein